MSDGQPSDPPPPDEMRTLSDQAMTSCATEPSSPKLVSTKEAKKMAKAKLKMRRSTPAPPTKENGRKRFIPSPLPEDKQLRKKIDFGEEEDTPLESPKCKGRIFPATPNGETEGIHQPEMLEQRELNKEHAMDKPTKVGESPSNKVRFSGQVPGQVAGEGSVGVEITVTQTSHDNTLVLGAAKTFEMLGEEKVKLLEMGIGTNLPCESAFVPYSPSESHVAPLGSPPMQPKVNEILQLAALDSSEKLDAASAQPLLTGILPEVGHNTAEGSKNMATRIKSLTNTPWNENGPPIEDFPPLERGRTRKIRATFEGGPKHNDALLGYSVSTMKTSVTRVSHGPESMIKATANTKEADVEPETTTPTDTPMGEASTQHGLEGGENIQTEKNKAEHNIPKGYRGADERNGNAPKSMADMVRGPSTIDGPQVFDPESIQKIGYATTSNGVPAIYFSGAEIQKLATSLGHAIVGKFSHSIPASHQIQKALENIKFRRGFTWKYINAKHILVQFEDIADYARLLSGPKGTPVWYVDRHPMRVFKWSTDFDAYCESPIAAIWCNLVGLPIHLFDHAALFAIGKLLGTPIQVDRATANKSRLSFARLCVEIDITKPPPEEIILDICGRETVQQVKWDKIPSYCRECKHVGHKSEVCYATRPSERPPKRNYNINPLRQPHNGNAEANNPKNSNMASPRQPHLGGIGAKKNIDESRQTNNNMEWKQQGKHKGKESNTRMNPKASVHTGAEWSGPDFLGDMHGPGSEEMIIAHNVRVPNQARDAHTKAPSFENGRRNKPREADLSRHEGLSASDDLVQPKGHFKPFALENAEDPGSSSHMSTNRYFSLMARENFMENDMEDDENWEDTISHKEDEDGANPALLEAETPHGGSNLQIMEFQGGASIPPGTNPSS